MSVERVGIVLPDLGGGGVQRVLVNLAQGMVERGVDVRICTLEERPVKLALPPGVAHHALGGRNPLASIGALQRIVASERIDALVGGITRANLAALAAARGKVRTLLTKHLPVDMLSSSALRRIGLRTLIRNAYARADAVVAVSVGTYESLLTTGLPAARVHRIANPVLGDDVAARSAASIDEPWLVGVGPPVIVAAGRLVPQKDFATLLRAFALVRAHVEARLIVLGEGPERVALERLATSHGITTDVRFRGHVSDVMPYFANAAAVVATSRWEGLPTTIIEALAAGASVVSTDCRTGPREILRDGALGALVPVGDAEAVAGAVLDALDRPHPIAASALDRYRIPTAAAAYMRLLEAL